MKKLPIGIQNLRKIIEGDYVYIDKTQYVYKLTNDASYYFLSRPRRFGKSLLLDTIAEAFSGDKELFKGLFIYDSDYSFEKHPVIRLDMSNVANDTPEKLESALCSALRVRIDAEQFCISSELPSDLFKSLIEALYKKYGKSVVVLIDEYDKPMLDQMHDIKLMEANRDVIRGFYGILKSMDPFLRLTFITGVTKFSKTSVFSGLNNLLDITMIEDYVEICGIPADKLNEHFKEHIESIAKESGLKNSNHIYDGILEWYDGYSWDGMSRLINPFSLLSFLLRKRFYSFWYASGTPTFLIKLLKEKPSSYLALNDLEISELSLDLMEISKMSVAPLLFQTGYLTVDKVKHDPPPAYYKLRMPNLEVREAFNLQIISEFTENDHDVAEAAYRRIRESLINGDLEVMLDILKSLFSSIPYQLHVNSEAYYHSIFYAVMTVLGFDINAEVSVAAGRIDATLEFSDKVYIIEFKYKNCPVNASDETKRGLFDSALDEGMEQIISRGYAKKYKSSGKEIFQAVFAFIGRDEIELRVV